MKWILMIAWAANGTAYTTQEFDTRDACVKAAEWVQANNYRGGRVATVCINTATGGAEAKGQR
jgi:hypothetical protein